MKIRQAILESLYSDRPADTANPTGVIFGRIVAITFENIILAYFQKKNHQSVCLSVCVCPPLTAW
jgi:hypothetical protein